MVSSPAKSLRRRGWRIGWISVVVIGLIATAAALIQRATSSDVSGPKLTHRVERGDLVVTVTEQGTLESSGNHEIKCKVRGANTVIWVVESGSYVEPGDELVRLDTLFIEEQINERSKYAHWSRSGAERSKADVARAELAIDEYLEGRYVAEVSRLQKDLAIAESNLRTTRSMLDYSRRMAERGYVSGLDVEEKEFAVEQAVLAVELKKTEIDVLSRYTKAIEVETLKGNLAAGAARHEANKERAFADAHRRDRALEELEHCVVTADRSGMVIHPSAAAWRDAPEIAEGATVHKDQVLLLMPDLTQMQVKIGVHESVVDRVQSGQTANVMLNDERLTGTVTSVASVTSPAGWWTGNVVKYETIIGLPSVQGLRPGMSAAVDVILAEYQDVLLIPVSAVLETNDGDCCWVKSEGTAQRRSLQLGDTNDIFIIVESGLQEGEEVILNPLAHVEEARGAALRPGQASTSGEDSGASDSGASDSGASETEGAEVTEVESPPVDSPSASAP